MRSQCSQEQIERIRLGIARREFVLHYQPIVCLATKQLEGYEALARWQHPEKGLIYPDDFLPELAKCHSIHDLCHEVIRQVARIQPSTKEWISFNVSSLTIERDDWPDIAKLILSESHIEVTERERVLESAKQRLAEQQGRGVQIVIDDFGIGYSNFASLEWANCLKIDKSLTKDIAIKPKAWAICQAIITLAHACELKAIAEGIETKEQALLLRQFQCDYGQGYLFGRPAPLPAITRSTSGAIH